MISTPSAITRRRLLTGAAALSVLPACAARVPTSAAPVSEQEIGGVPLSQIVDGYGLIEDAATGCRRCRRNTSRASIVAPMCPIAAMNPLA
ncbi:hypothetical protein MBELCI_1086 [Limimaricola cinnabarinus LL-001]|uniref:Uncharacterized protein n=2 Tax=Limimaricola cinnabarinus TaxID=1125964 RepID=U3ABJ1_9RHOB|nr:hypothetical protein MBELCI_1086 [Limimaricola cinnabarinus LL-001]